MTPEVDAAVRAFLAENEGDAVAWWYNDTSPSDPHGVTTIGTGNAFRTRPGEAQLGPGTAAAWDACRLLPRGMSDAYYATNIPWRADPAKLLELLESELARFEADLLVQFPDMPTWPTGAIVVAFDVAWQDGDRLATAWPHLTACLRALDWRGAADQCATSLSAGGNPTRNAARKRVLLECVAASDSTS